MHLRLFVAIYLQLKEIERQFKNNFTNSVGGIEKNSAINKKLFKMIHFLNYLNSQPLTKTYSINNLKL